MLSDPFHPIPNSAIDSAERYVRDILTKAVEYHEATEQALLIYDKECTLTRAVTEAYRRALPKAKCLDFDDLTVEAIREEFSHLHPSDLVVLVQSTNFRLNDFRIRVDLFNRSIKVIEHPHLSRLAEGQEQLYYIDSLAYDADYYREVGRKIQEKINQSRTGVLKTGGADLYFNAGFEPAKLNVGDYSGMRNIGGMFPIGEVFTESKILEEVNGQVKIFAFGDRAFNVNLPTEPITLIVEQGRVQRVENSTPEFDAVIENIKKDEEGEVWLRELGFGLNNAFTKKRIVADIGTYERMRGIHLSLGAKHNVYKKPGFKFNNRTARHHVDVFADTQAVLLDGENIYSEEAWLV